MSGWNLTKSGVKHEDGYATFSWDEFMSQAWPPCPVCGEPVVVEPSPVLGGLGNFSKRYKPGRAKCPRRCNLDEHFNEG